MTILGPCLSWSCNPAGRAGESKIVLLHIHDGCITHKLLLALLDSVSVSVWVGIDHIMLLIENREILYYAFFAHTQRVGQNSVT
jgi:hypothetical protein